MIYYTQLIFIKLNKEELFHSFEEVMLPLLKKYNGELLYRLRPDQGSVIEANREVPYEIHLLSFAGRDDFENYKNDPVRGEMIAQKNMSVEKSILIEGNLAPGDQF